MALRAPIAPAIRQAVIERLKEDPLASHAEVASQLGVSRHFVSAVSRKLNDSGDESEKQMKALAKQIGKRLSIAERAMVYEEVIRGKGDPKASFSKLSALKRVEELEGIVTKKEQKESADNSSPSLPVMFQLPENTSIDIGIRIKRGK